jgi:hypothetical protein
MGSDVDLRFELRDRIANLLDDAYTFMTKGLVHVAAMLIGTANATVGDLDQDLVLLEIAVGDLLFLDLARVRTLECSVVDRHFRCVG